jgi:uncharacterized membrane protein YbhN (UPF0104 family)
VSRRRRALRLAVAAASLGAVALAARHLDAGEVAGAIRRVDPIFGLLAALAVLGAKIGAKAMRSQLLLDASCRRLGLSPPPFAATARLLAASHAAGQLAWGPLGFTVRTIALCDAGMPLGAVVRVHVAERIAEAAGLAAIALAALAFSPAAILGSWLGRVLLAALAAAALAGLAVAASPRLRALVVRYADTGGALARSSAWALASSLADIAVLWLAARGMHISLDLPTAVLAFLAVNGAGAVPITPAQLGVQESAIVVALATGGIAAPQALACALAYRAAHIVPLALVGLPALLATWARRSRIDSPVR